MGAVTGQALPPPQVSDKFAFGLFDLDWDVFTQHIEGAVNRVPVLEKTGVKSTVCGPGEWGGLGAGGWADPGAGLRQAQTWVSLPSLVPSFQQPWVVGIAPLLFVSQRPELGQGRNLPLMSKRPGFFPPQCELLLMSSLGS